MTKAEQTKNKLKRRARRRFARSIFLFTSIFLVGGTLIALLILLEHEGVLGPIFAVLGDVFIANQTTAVLVVFWVLVIPLLLSVLLTVNAVRRSKFRHYRLTFEETVRIAVDAEKAAFAAEQEKKRRRNRFSRLNEITPDPTPPQFGAVRSLRELCEKFRMFAATNLHLYYTEAQVREFVASLSVSHILILQGMSGTGKTSLTYAFGEFIGNPSTIIPVQPMWKERSDLLGYYNEFTKKYNETELLRKMYEANGRNEIFITVLDEMNIARVEYYFAEFLSLLEIPNPELRYLEVVTDKWDDDPPQLKDGHIKLPENMWFVGTANNDDSTFAISDKVYDRAMIVNLDNRTPPFAAEELVPVTPISYAEFIALSESAKRGYELTRRNERRLQELDEYLIAKFQITFGNRIMRQIRSYISVYVGCGGDELDALDDILCKKVLRKLTYKDLSLLRGELDEAAKYFETLFGEGKMPQCRSFLARVIKM